MNTFVLACETLRPELEMLAEKMRDPPPINFLEPNLHSYPGVLRKTFNEAVSALESQSDDPVTILCGYGLCGRALCGAYAERATLVFPRLHDCIAFIRGLKPEENRASSREGGFLWMFPGMLKYQMVPRHLKVSERFAGYEKKYGAVKAARMILAEYAMFSNYTQACHIRWPEMGDAYMDDAQKVAKSVSLPYTELAGSSWYMQELLAGGMDPDYFLRLQPGQTIDMDVRGGICAVPLDAVTSSLYA